MTERAAATLDVREMPPGERHPRIFEMLDGLRPGQALRLVNDHDPKPLYPGPHPVAVSRVGPNDQMPLRLKNRLPAGRPLAAVSGGLEDC